MILLHIHIGFLLSQDTAPVLENRIGQNSKCAGGKRENFIVENRMLDGSEYTVRRRVFSGRRSLRAEKNACWKNQKSFTTVLSVNHAYSETVK